ncbi:hypothetical protein fh0823_24310 [Francisella halioticida]|nr:hypothetical protein [Francisella halioticida]BCD92292.1 hypothetical protein fh0823_24310 [Francisella halioticida]
MSDKDKKVEPTEEKDINKELEEKNSIVLSKKERISYFWQVVLYCF